MQSTIQNNTIIDTLSRRHFETKKKKKPVILSKKHNILSDLQWFITMTAVLILNLCVGGWLPYFWVSFKTVDTKIKKHYNCTIKKAMR